MDFLVYKSQLVVKFKVTLIKMLLLLFYVNYLFLTCKFRENNNSHIFSEIFNLSANQY